MVLKRQAIDSTILNTIIQRRLNEMHRVHELIDDIQATCLLIANDTQPYDR